MKKENILLYIIMLLAICVSNTNAQWIKTGPSGGWINKFLINGNNIYAAAYGGVLVSTDAGLDWSHSNWGLIDGDIRSVAATSTKVFAGTYSSGVYMRDINGLIWQQTSLTEQSITCFATIGDYVFVGTYSNGVFLSKDNGLTWTKMNNGLTDHQVECLAVKGTSLFAGTSSEVFLSTDMGASWNSASTGLPNNNILTLAVNGSNLYAGVSGTGAYVSSNNGQGWTQLGDCPTHYVYSFAFEGTKIFAAGQKICVTTNDGADWTNLSEDNSSLPYANIQALCCVGGNIIAGDNAVNVSSGIYVSANDGQTWMQTNVGVPNYSTNGIAANNGTLLDATSGGVFYSTDDGVEWNNPTMHGEHSWADFSAVAFRGSNYVFVGDGNGYVYISTNAGKELTLQTQIEQGVSISSFAFIGTNVFASTRPYMSGVAGGVYLSSDNGANWASVSKGLPTLADTNTYVNSLVVIGTNLFAGTGHGIYLSTDNGANWKKVNNGLKEPWVYSLTVKGTELFAGTIQGVFRSNDNGTSWSHKLLKNNNYITSLITVDTSVFAGTRTGVYRLINSDSTWTFVGLPYTYVTSFAASNGYLFAATINNSIWKTPISELTDVVEGKNIIPGEFILKQNYPNPFNPSTSIKYEISSRQFVTLQVFDILGREIKTLVNEEKPAGSYNITFDASGLSSGIYFYRMRAGKYSETKKMILLR